MKLRWLQSVLTLSSANARYRRRSTRTKVRYSLRWMRMHIVDRSAEIDRRTRRDSFDVTTVIRSLARFFVVSLVFPRASLGLHVENLLLDYTSRTFYWKASHITIGDYYFRGHNILTFLACYVGVSTSTAYGRSTFSAAPILFGVRTSMSLSSKFFIVGNYSDLLETGSCSASSVNTTNHIGHDFLDKAPNSRAANGPPRSGGQR